MSKKSHGQTAYEAYTAAVGGTTSDVKPLPSFDELRQHQKAGWEAVAAKGGFALGVGDSITTTSGITGKVGAICIGKEGRLGYWLDGIDSTGRPFEQYVPLSEVA